MALQSIWYYTDLPSKVVDIIEEDVKKFDNDLEESQVIGGVVDTVKRNSHNAWVPAHHWVGGFIWHYIQRANRENFLFDLDFIDNESIQYTHYGPGQYYGWHTDAGLQCQYEPKGIANIDEPSGVLQEDFINTTLEKVRKLSFTLQLSDPDDYEGGNVQLINEEGKSYIAPRKRGTIVLFDSRTQHRVLKVTKGVRKSIVGWVMGPRWK